MSDTEGCGFVCGIPRADHQTEEHPWQPAGVTVGIDEERLARVIRVLRSRQDWPDDNYWLDALYRQKDGDAEVAAAIARAYEAEP